MEVSLHCDRALFCMLFACSLHALCMLFAAVALAALSLHGFLMRQSSSSNCPLQSHQQKVGGIGKSTVSSWLVHRDDVRKQVCNRLLTRSDRCGQP